MGKSIIHPCVYTVFDNANEAFVELYKHISSQGVDRGGTKAVFNTGFYIKEPLMNHITEPKRAWSLSYAKREWQWYLSKNRSVAELKKFAPIWDKMHSGDDIVNSNYGFAWSENNQINKCLAELTRNPDSRRAWVSIFDGKRKDDYEFDTPCTLSIGFSIDGDKLNMSVLMRSNDLWFGFCNDQYCFSKLMHYFLYALNHRQGYPKYKMGLYFHYAHDLHIYDDKLGLL